MKFLALLSTPLICLILLSQSVGAFNLFSNCVTEADGTKVCGPCATNQSAPTCQQSSNQTNSGENPVTHTINVAANILALATGIGAVIIIIIGGLTMVTSGGNSEAVTAARRRITYAIIGLVVVALAWTITRFITDKLIQ